MTDSQELLAEYVRTGADAAFRELVGRYVNLVYSTALRLVHGAPHQAEDVAQIVFSDLARQAGKLPADVQLGGWLHRHTCFVAAHVLRGERRRQWRERQAVEMNQLNSSPETDFTPVAPLLDAAINELDETDRTVILLRFYEQRDFPAVGRAIGRSEDAARMRVNRALEKLQGLLHQRGITTTATALAVALPLHAVQAAPVGLAAAIASTALAGMTGGGTVTLLKIITMTKLKLGLISALVVAALATDVAVQHHTNSRLRQQNEALAAQLARLNELAAANQQLSNLLAQARSRATLLQDQLTHQAKPSAGATPNPGAGTETAANSAAPAASKLLATVLDSPTVALTPSSQWVNAGRATPDASLETFHWALAQHDTNAFAQALAWDPAAQAKAEELFNAAPEAVRQKFGSIDGVVYALLSRLPPMSGYAVVSENTSGDSGTLVEQHEYEDGRVRQNQVNLHHFDDGWRVVLGDDLLMRGFDIALRHAAAAGQ